MKISEIIKKIEDFAPLSLAEDWDNTGLLSGDLEIETQGVIICLDINEAVLDKCIETNSKLCICHHPFIFNPISRLDYADPYSLLLGKFIKNDIVIYAAHTNLDCCVGGVNDCLAKKLGIEVIETFLPAEIPVDFKKGVVPGIGRIGILKNTMNLFDFYKDLNRNLGIRGCAINFDSDKNINRILIAGGSYDSGWNKDVLDINVDLVISGEIKHHDMMFFQRYKIAAIAAGHDASERIILKPLAGYLENKFPDIKFDVLYNLDYNKVVF